MVIEGVVGALDSLPTLAAVLLGLLEILLADGFVLKEMVAAAELHIAHMALHAVRVVVGLVVDYTVPHDLLLAHTALLRIRLVTLGAVGVVVFCEEFSLQLLATVFTPEAFLVENFAQSSASIFGEGTQATVTVSCRLVNCFHGSVPNFSHHLRVVQVDFRRSGQAFGRTHRRPEWWFRCASRAGVLAVGRGQVPRR